MPSYSNEFSHKTLIKKSKNRRDNLLRLKNYFGSIDNSNCKKKKYTNLAFCERLGISTSLYSQLMNPEIKPIFHERYVIHIESICNLRKGWLSTDFNNLNINDLSIDFDLFMDFYNSYEIFINSDIYDNLISSGLGKMEIFKKIFIYISLRPIVEDINIDNSLFSNVFNIKS